MSVSKLLVCLFVYLFSLAVCFLWEMKGHCFDVSVVKVWSPTQVMNVLPVIVFIVWT